MVYGKPALSVAPSNLLLVSTIQTKVCQKLTLDTLALCVTFPSLEPCYLHCDSFLQRLKLASLLGGACADRSFALISQIGQVVHKICTLASLNRNTLIAL